MYEVGTVGQSAQGNPGVPGKDDVYHSFSEQNTSEGSREIVSQSNRQRVRLSTTVLIVCYEHSVVNGHQPAKDYISMN